MPWGYVVLLCFLSFPVLSYGFFLFWGCSGVVLGLPWGWMSYACCVMFVDVSFALLELLDHFETF